MSGEKRDVISGISRLSLSLSQKIFIMETNTFTFIFFRNGTRGVLKIGSTSGQYISFSVSKKTLRLD